ncbi:MAG TPA: DUF504 domain-containing protein [Candidatus Nitrosopolaris sp.]|nr:DUF504 domain-containing protein [Candidatus Nitrosopolaris sp.]
MPKKGRLEEIFSKALYADDPNLYSVYYRDLDSLHEVSLSEFVNASENFELIPANRVMKITKEGKVLYHKKNLHV